MKMIDLQDVLLAAGIVLLLAGVATFSWRAALILGGCISLGCVYLIEISSKRIRDAVETKKSKIPHGG